MILKRVASMIKPMKPVPYLLRIEGVNLDHVIDDTNQLSVRRGASIRLRQSVHWKIPKWLDDQKKEGLIDSYEIISSGSSIGLYSVWITDAEELRKRVIDQLTTGRFAYFTFTVVLEPQGESFHEALIRAESKARYQQMRSLSFSLKEIAAHSGEKEWADCEASIENPGSVCQWDGVRAANCILGRREDGECKGYEISSSVHARYQSGRLEHDENNHSDKDNKKMFIKEETGRELDFVFELEQLSTFKANDEPFHNFTNLNGKMAVLYFDGNSFGSIKKELKSAEELKKFDRAIIDARKAVLNNLFDQFGDEKSFINRVTEESATGKRIITLRRRFELLQWGGDEMLLIVPAWLGFSVLQLFYEQQFVYAGTKLSHAGGLLFCSRKTPIARAQALAVELAESCKQVSRKENLYACMALESIDFPTQPLETFLKQRFHALGKLQLPHHVNLAGSSWNEKMEAVRIMKEKIPRSKIYSILGDLFQKLQSTSECNNDSKLASCLSNTLIKLQQILKTNSLESEFETWQELFPIKTEEWLDATALDAGRKRRRASMLPLSEPLWQWLYLLEYWDYLLAPTQLDLKTANQEDSS